MLLDTIVSCVICNGVSMDKENSNKTSSSIVKGQCSTILSFLVECEDVEAMARNFTGNNPEAPDSYPSVFVHPNLDEFNVDSASEKQQKFTLLKCWVTVYHNNFATLSMSFNYKEKEATDTEMLDSLNAFLKCNKDKSENTPFTQAVDRFLNLHTGNGIFRCWTLKADFEPFWIDINSSSEFMDIWARHSCFQTASYIATRNNAKGDDGKSLNIGSKSAKATIGTVIEEKPLDYFILRLAGGYKFDTSKDVTSQPLPCAKNTYISFSYHGICVAAQANTPVEEAVAQYATEYNALVLVTVYLKNRIKTLNNTLDHIAFMDSPETEIEEIQKNLAADQSGISYYSSLSEENSSQAHRNFISAFSETAGISAAIEDIRKAKDKAQDKIKEIKSQKTDEEERGRNRIISVVAVFAIVSACKDGCDLFREALLAIIRPDSPEILSSVIAVFFAALCIALIPLTLKYLRSAGQPFFKKKPRTEEEP